VNNSFTNYVPPPLIVPLESVTLRFKELDYTFQPILPTARRGTNGDFHMEVPMRLADVFDRFELCPLLERERSRDLEICDCRNE
jgi:hypothetical protein